MKVNIEMMVDNGNVFSFIVYSLSKINLYRN